LEQVLDYAFRVDRSLETNSVILSSLMWISRIMNDSIEQRRLWFLQLPDSFSASALFFSRKALSEKTCGSAFVVDF